MPPAGVSMSVIWTGLAWLLLGLLLGSDLDGAGGLGLVDLGVRQGGGVSGGAGILQRVFLALLITLYWVSM